MIEIPIEELPSSFQNLIGLQHLCLGCSRIVQSRSSIAMMPKLFVFEAYQCNGEEGEIKVGLVVSSKVEEFMADFCNL